MGVPPRQLPVWQVSAPLQALPSEHGVPSARLVCPHWPFCGLQLSLVLGLSSSQLMGVPALQLPFCQVSAPLQALPSEQEVPLVRLRLRQPVCGSQLSAVHGLPSSQMGGGPPTQ